MEFNIRSFNPYNADKFPRYIIVNNHNEKWCAENQLWVKNKKKATIFADLALACKELKELKDKYDAKPKHYFEVQMNIRLTTDGEVNIGDLEEYARQAIKVLINRDVPLPAPGAEIEVFIPWDIKKKEPKNE